MSARTLVAAMMLAVALATIAGAWAFELIGGFVPCKLCLQERIPYYVGIPVLALALASSFAPLPESVTRLLVALAALVFTASAVLGGYHAGVEWGWWQGPADCAGAAGITTDASNLLADINATTPPACDQAAGRFLGLSFAGWNVIASIAIAVGCLRGAFSQQK